MRNDGLQFGLPVSSTNPTRVFRPGLPVSGRMPEESSLRVKTWGTSPPDTAEFGSAGPTSEQRHLELAALLLEFCRKVWEKGVKKVSTGIQKDGLNHISLSAWFLVLIFTLRHKPRRSS